MAKVISSSNIDKYNVGRYHFKVLSSDDGDDTSHPPQEMEKLQPITPVVQPAPVAEPQVDSSAISQKSRDALIESLMKKTDEMSSNFIKLQMKLESKEEEYKLEIQKAKEEAYAQGVAAGVEQSKNDFGAEMGSKLMQYSESVLRLDNTAKEFERSLEGIKGSLISAAIDIATEVIRVELGENSSKVATILSEELIKELQNASKVTLKVNPEDHLELVRSVGKLENVDIVSDNAVSKGGVIALSEVGNIDSQIHKRFERVKKAALSE
ncbi:MAG: flagellar assembly protein FliH [Campylobacterales bacterium]|nr:flagellar assembly protein FliH [Campylobacterales bacterium]